MQADGKVLVGGAFSNLAGRSSYHLGRLTVAGAADASFSCAVEPAGSAAVVNTLLLQADGKIVVGGVFTKLGGQTRTNLGRVTTSGSAEAAFNLAVNGPVYAVTVQSGDGKLLVGGQFSMIGTALRQNLGRLNADGSVDTPFKPRANAAVRAFAVQSGTLALTAGDFTLLGGKPRTSIGRVLLSGYAAASNTLLSSLRLDVPSPDVQTGALTPVFSGATLNYNVLTVRHALGVKAITSDSNASLFVRANTGAFYPALSGTPSVALPLAIGNNTLAVKVVADDGLTSQTYSIAASRSLSEDATLGGLALDGGSLHPTFTASGTRYSVELWGSLSDASGTVLRVMPVKNNAYSLVQARINGEPYAFVTGTSAPLLLRQGTNAVEILVTAEDRATTKTYTLLTGSVAASSDASLSALSLSEGVLNPGFVETGTTYGTIVTGSGVAVRAIAGNPNATLTVSLNGGAPVPIFTGVLSASLPLQAGSNRIVVQVTSEADSPKTSYAVRVTRVDAAVVRTPDLTVPGAVTLASSLDTLLSGSGSSWFEFGPTTAYGYTAPALATGSAPVLFGATLSNLPDVPAYGIWHYRLVSSLWGDTFHGPDRTFAFSWPSTVPVAITGDSMPGIPGATLRSLGGPAINNRGDIAFQAAVSGSGITTANASLIWVESDPDSYPAVRSGDPAPGTDGVFSGFYDPVMNNNGALAFLGNLVLASSKGIIPANSRGLWTTVSGSLQLVARSQTQGYVPRHPDALFAAFSQVVLPDRGGPIFLGRLVPGFGGVTGSNSIGIWASDVEGNLQTMLQQDDRIPFGTGWKTVRTISGIAAGGQNRSFTTDGAVVVTVMFSDKTSGLVRINPARTSGSPTLARAIILADGSAAPGVPNARFSWFFGAVVNNANRLAFRAMCAVPNQAATITTGIWADHAGVRSLLARVGGAAPGIPRGVLTGLFDPLSNNQDRIAFLGQYRISETTELLTGFWVTNDAGKPEIKARLRRSVVPGYPSGVFFSNIRQFALPDTGRVVMLADLSGAVEADSNQGIWTIDANGHPVLVVRKGGGLTVDGVPKKVIALALLTGTAETASQTRAFNTTGQTVYKAWFSDGTQGVFQVQL